MTIFEIAWLTFKWGAGVSIGLLSLSIAWTILIAISKGIAEGISNG